MLDQKMFLLQNNVNPFPVPGVLALSDDGRLAFRLDASSAGASLGWLEKRMGADGLKDRLAAGEPLAAFDLPVDGRRISWPKMLGGYGMKIEDGEQKWLVSINQPSGGQLWTLLNMATAKKHTKPWKDAFAAAGSS